MRVSVWPWILVLSGCGSIAGGEREGADGGSMSEDAARSDSGVVQGPGPARPDASDTAPDTGPRASPDAGAVDAGRVDAGPPASNCDYRFGQDGVLRIEAEDLPLVDAWEVRTEEDGFSGTGYILWTGRSSNNRPDNGTMAVRLAVPTSGRYRLQWRNRIGRGNNPTEHNDTWVRFPDAADAYGKRGNPENESRRYPKPICEDEAFIDGIRSRVSEARCAQGSTRDGWMKVYSSGARDWRWSTRTSDNDAHDIFVEFDRPGDYTLELSQRADFHLIDRIVLHREDVARQVVEDALPPTPCQ